MTGSASPLQSERLNLGSNGSFQCYFNSFFTHTLTHTPAPFGGVALRSRQATGEPSPRGGVGGKKAAEEPKAEFQGFRLRRTLRDKDREAPREKAPTQDSKFDFGVKLKVRSPPVCGLQACCDYSVVTTA